MSTRWPPKDPNARASAWKADSSAGMSLFAIPSIYSWMAAAGVSIFDMANEAKECEEGQAGEAREGATDIRIK